MANVGRKAPGWTNFPRILSAHMTRNGPVNIWIRPCQQHGRHQHCRSTFAPDVRALSPLLSASFKAHRQAGVDEARACRRRRTAVLRMFLEVLIWSHNTASGAEVVENLQLNTVTRADWVKRRRRFDGKHRERTPAVSNPGRGILTPFVSPMR